MASAGFENYQGTQIFVFNFRDSPVKDSLKAISEGKRQVAGCAPGTLLTLTDVTGAEVDDSVTQALRELAKHNRPFVKAAAVVGVTGLKKVIFNMIILFSKRQMSLFDDLPTAKSWLKTQA